MAKRGVPEGLKVRVVALAVGVPSAPLLGRASEK